MASLALAAVLAAGCGLNVQSPDLFMMTRTGQGSSLTLLVNDSGTIRCNGGASKSLPDSMLLTARDLANSLNTDAKAKLRLRASPRTVFSYRVKLSDGTITFPDTAAAAHNELAQAELFAVQAAQGPCR
ncbi:MAG: hypothetical protein J2P39_09515 [Candidatus Dormibacteraeota bacterium]|nr:hypothetical protein [Candidatus Dormibacteraeota bacterium]